ncbi:hypothetical protein AVEN_166191-1 [Araneus ventricosus]|uniref:Uncharacterized protein n=1 Tax=Araneus ventricosus TaxID=182803 RepID=A0A4Y2DDR5_ARAVE|nr:hypothetical protein AVEN_166191-1 [Araneus ventricosus]
MRIQKAAEVFKNSHVAARESRGTTCINVPEDINNRANMADDVIISDDDAVEGLLNKDDDNDFEQEQFLQLTSSKGAKVQ